MASSTQACPPAKRQASPAGINHGETKRVLHTNEASASEEQPANTTKAQSKADQQRDKERRQRFLAIKNLQNIKLGYGTNRLLTGFHKTRETLARLRAEEAATGASDLSAQISSSRIGSLAAQQNEASTAEIDTTRSDAISELIHIQGEDGKVDAQHEAVNRPVVSNSYPVPIEGVHSVASAWANTNELARKLEQKDLQYTAELKRRDDKIRRAAGQIERDIKQLLENGETIRTLCGEKQQLTQRIKEKEEDNERLIEANRQKDEEIKRLRVEKKELRKLKERLRHLVS